jgi:hypothetical protein
MKQRLSARLMTVMLILAFGYQSFLPFVSAASQDQTNSPAVKVYYVTPEQFSEIEPFLQERGLTCTTNAVMTNGVVTTTFDQDVVVAPNRVETSDGMESQDTMRIRGGMVGSDTVKPVDPSTIQPLAVERVHSQPSNEQIDRTSNVVGDLIVEIIDTDWTSSDAAIVIFVIIGVTVVFSVVVYAGVYLYEIVTGTGDYDYWCDFQARFATVSGGSNRGQLVGGKFAAGFERGNMRTGMLLEGGYLDLHVKLDEVEERVRAEGGYLMAGAGVQWQFGDTQNPSGLGLELLAGVADDPGVDLLSVARAHLGLGIGAYGRLGLSIGALMVGLEPEEGFVGNHHQFIPILGFETGLRF